MFALVDCNNFYVSCERVFNPKLNNKPVIVLSNNDGCAIARSEEAKALGVAMGTPLYQLKDKIKQDKIIVLSSNYALYGDLSQRVMNILKSYEEECECYSIDEAFLSIPAKNATLEYAQEIRAKIKKHTGIPVSIGIAATKTLAKLANKIAKKESSGVSIITSEADNSRLLSETKVEKVWGIGQRRTEKLKEVGIENCLQLTRADGPWLRQKFSINCQRTSLELQGVACIELEKESPKRQTTVFSRSFSKGIKDLISLEEAIATFATKVSEKLQEENLITNNIQIFIATDRFSSKYLYKANHKKHLESPTNTTSIIVKQALELLRQIYREGCIYKKAGVMANELSDATIVQLSLFGAKSNNVNQQLATAVKIIKKNWGKEAINIAATGLKREWKMQQTYKSPSYTTSWQELARVK